jgi:hypothetical protein
MTRRLAATAAAILAFAIAGCQATPAPSATPLPTIPAGPTVTVTEYHPGTRAWQEGFVITLEQATASLDAKGGPVDVVLIVENPGTEDATLDAPIRLTSGSASFQLAHGAQAPQIPAGESTFVTFEFEVTGQGSIDDGVVTIGRPSDHIAAIPLKPDPAHLVALQPETATLKGSGTLGSLKAAIHRYEIRWDLPDWHDELPLGTEVMTVTYDMTYIGSFAGGTAFTRDDVALRLPGGTVVRTRADGHSQSIVALDPGKIARNLFSRFEIPNGLTGEFALLLRAGSKSKAITFTVPS